MKRALLRFLLTLLLTTPLAAYADDLQKLDPIDLGAKRELFIDDYLVDQMENVALTIHSPERKEIAAQFDRPWEDGGEGYATILKEDGKYRAYYRAWGLKENYPMKDCCLESDDGLKWTRPELGLCEYEGVSANNIMLDEVAGTQLGTQDFTPFRDPRPDCPDDERYKAVGNGFGAFEGRGPHGLFGWKSADGVHWTLVQSDPIFTDGKFDTQNIAFWSELEKKFVLYYREFTNNVRVIVRATSDDFRHWTREGEIQFPNGGGPSLREQFYTNQIQPYYRASHIYVGFPTRYVDNGLIESTKHLPEWQDRQRRMKLFSGGERLGTATTDILFITSRDGVNFNRADDVYIRPNLRVNSNWFYGDNYTAYNVVETKSADDDSPNELSIYVIEASNSHRPTRLRRYALRIDGFGSLHAKSREGVVVTKPLTFDGDKLSINVATSSAGYVKVELLDQDGNAIPGFSADDSDLIFGDDLDRVVTWKGKPDLASLANKPVRIRFIMYEADVYSLVFQR